MSNKPKTVTATRKDARRIKYGDSTGTPRKG